MELNGICRSQPETVGKAALRWQLGSRRCRQLQLVLSRRMADTAAFCVDDHFPRVPARQCVLSLPYALRFKMAYPSDATTMVLGAFISAINLDLRRRARKRKLRGRLQTGSLTVVQRFGSSLNLNVHFHVAGRLRATWGNSLGKTRTNS